MHQRDPGDEAPGRRTAKQRALALATRQSGLIARRQALDLGIDPGNLDKIAKREGWRRLLRGVWLVAGAPLPNNWRLRSVLLAMGPPVAATRWTALHLHGLHSSSKLLQIEVEHARRASTVKFVETLRSRSFDCSLVTEIDGIPVVVVERAIVDLAEVADVEALRGAVIDAIQRRLMSLEDLARTLLAAGSVTGRGKVHRIIGELDADAVDSLLEFEVMQWLRGLGYDVVAQFVLDTRTGTVRLDLAIVELKIAIEVQGFLAHSERRQLDVDARRFNAIKGAGWEALQITWDRFADDRDGFRADLDTVIANRVARMTATVGARPGRN